MNWLAITALAVGVLITLGYLLLRIVGRAFKRTADCALDLSDECLFSSITERKPEEWNPK